MMVVITIYLICAMIFAILMIRRMAMQPNPIPWMASDTLLCIVMSMLWPISTVVFGINQIFTAIHNYYTGDKS